MKAITSSAYFKTHFENTSSITGRRVTFCYESSQIERYWSFPCWWQTGDTDEAHTHTHIHTHVIYLFMDLFLSYVASLVVWILLSMLVVIYLFILIWFVVCLSWNPLRDFHLHRLLIASPLSFFYHYIYI